MGAVNRFPQGLLGLLQAKTVGRTPSEAEDKLQFGLDLTPYYLSGISLSIAEASASASTIGTYATIEVPQGQTWMVYAIESRLTAVTAGDTGHIAPEMFNIQGSTVGGMIFNETVLGFTFTAGIPGEIQSNKVVFPAPIAVRSPIGFRSRGMRLGAVTTLLVETRVLYYQLD